MSTAPQMLYREPVQLNSQLHRHKKLLPLGDFSNLAGVHSVYLNAAEFALAALAFPIVFLPPTKANPNVSPAAMLGLVPGQNLFVDGQRWDASYLPASFRRLPYLTAPLPGSDQIGVFIDEQWPTLNDEAGEPLFDEQGKHSPSLERAIGFLQAFDEESRRTTQLCNRVQALGLFTDMKADLNLPDGKSLSINGFMAVDEDKLAALPDADLLDLGRSGALGMLHAHLLSLGHVRLLVDRLARRGMPADAGEPPATATA